MFFCQKELQGWAYDWEVFTHHREALDFMSSRQGKAIVAEQCGSCGQRVCYSVHLSERKQGVFTKRKNVVCPVCGGALLERVVVNVRIPGLGSLEDGPAPQDAAAEAAPARPLTPEKAPFCHFCQKELEGWIYDADQYYTHPQTVNVASVIAEQCAVCGTRVCAWTHEKQLVKDKRTKQNTCPVCGGRLNARVVLDYKSPHLDALAPAPYQMEQDGAVTGGHLWAPGLLDRLTGERLLASVEGPGQAGMRGWRLALTDRRLVYLEQENIQGKANQLVTQDSYFRTLPLSQVEQVGVEKQFLGGTLAALFTCGGEKQVYHVDKEITRQIEQAVQAAAPALRLPEGEQLIYEGGGSHHFLAPEGAPLGGFKNGSEIWEQRFLRAWRISLAVTNRRMLFYCISHLSKMDANPGGVNVSLGKPYLQYISLPWNRIQEVKAVQPLGMEMNVSMMVTGALFGWFNPGLIAYADDELHYSLESRPCSKCGETVFGGIGGQAHKNARGEERSASGTWCPQCRQSLHPFCGGIGSALSGRCPVCKGKLQAIDLAYGDVFLQGRALQEAPFLAGRQSLAPLGDPGAPWKLPLTNDKKEWENRLLPALRKAAPGLEIILPEKKK